MSYTYAIVGTGAVGGFYGAQLARAGFRVSFLLRRDYEHVRRHGLVVLSPDGDVTLPSVQAYDNPGDMPRVDVVIVALKATGNDALTGILPQLVHAGSMVVLVQNGLGCEETIAPVAAPARLVGGLAFIAATRTGPGLIRHLGYSRLDLAAYHPDGVAYRPDQGLQQLASELGRADIPVRLFDDLQLARWRKLVWNIPFSGLSVALDADTRRIVEDPDAFAMAKSLMADVAAAAGACGKQIPDEFLHDMAVDTQKMAPYLPSLKIDFDAGAPMELEAIFGNPLRASIAAGYPAPLISQMYRQLRFLERNQRRNH